MDLDILEQVQGNIIGNCLCVLGDSMAMPVASMLKHFREEFEQHMEEARIARDGRVRVLRRRRAGRVAEAELPVARPEPNWITFEIDGRQVRAPEGAMLVDAAKHGDVEIPFFCYEPKLGQPVGACRMCLVEIEGIPKLQTSCSTPGARRHGRQHDLGPRQARAERDRRVPARQPPARLPGLRQGRRVPAPGHLVRLGRRPLALHRPQAPLQEAARAVAARGDRPRALHPLLPLRALLPGGRRGLPARLPRARRPHLRRHPRRPALRRARSAATSSSSAPSARSPRPPTASARARGTSRARARSARCARRSATSS